MTAIDGSTQYWQRRAEQAESDLATARAEVERLTRERDHNAKVYEARLRDRDRLADEADATARAEVERLTRERDKLEEDAQTLPHPDDRVCPTYYDGCHCEPHPTYLALKTERDAAAKRADDAEKELERERGEYKAQEQLYALRYDELRKQRDEAEAARAVYREALEVLERAAVLLGEQLPPEVQPQWDWSAIQQAIGFAKNALAPDIGKAWLRERDELRERVAAIKAAFEKCDALDWFDHGSREIMRAAIFALTPPAPSDDNGGGK